MFMDTCQVTYIYGLYEVGKEDEIRYVGKTDNPIKRLRDHKNDKRLTSYKSCWVKSVISKGIDIGIKILKVVNQKEWKIHEIQIIGEMKENHNLVNLTDGGNGKMSNIYNKSFDECKLWLKSNKPDWVTGLKEYKKWSKMNDFPDFLPKAPNRVFLHWTTWGDYLGTGRLQSCKIKEFYYTYQEAKNYLKNNYEIKNSAHFRRLKLPLFIPKKPNKFYNEWLGWEDFLNYKSNFRKNREYLEFEDAKIWIKNNYGKITVDEYRQKSKNNTLVDFLPKKPEKYYKDFKWSEFLFTNGRRRKKDFYINFYEARDIVRSMNLKTNMEWRRWCKNKSEQFIRIPSSPEQVYEEWVDWYDWLGN